MKKLLARVFRNKEYMINEVIYDGYEIDLYDNDTDKWNFSTFISIKEGKYLPVGLMEILIYISQCGYEISFM